MTRDSSLHYQLGALEGFKLAAPATPLMLKAVTVQGTLDHLERGPFGKIVIEME